MVAPGAEDDDAGPSGAKGAGGLARGSGSARGPRIIRIAGPASPYDPTYHLLLRFDKIAEIVARERPDVLEVHSPYLAALGALRARPGTYGVRTFQWHSDFIDTYGGVLGTRMGPRAGRVVTTVTSPLWSLPRAIARRSQAVLVAAEWQVAKLRAHGVPNVVLHPFGVERDVFRPDLRDAAERDRLLARAGHDERSALVVAVGRFAVEKRWDLVLESFARLRRDRRAALVLFGDGPERARMEARAEALGIRGDVLFAGFVKERVALARALASSDVLLHACPFETFGLSLVEALSTGLPVIVPDEGGAAEVHRPSLGRATLAYPTGDVDAAARAAATMLDRRAEGEDALRADAVRAANHYPDVVQQVSLQVALYAQLLARAGLSHKDARS